MDYMLDIHSQAVTHTKNKILKDIDDYLGSKEELSSYEQYLMERRHYVDQIWINVWLTKITNDISKKEKKQFLKQREYEVDGVDRKVINRLFRTEMRSHHPFDVLSWLNDTFFRQKNVWEKRYHAARELFLQEKAENNLEHEKTSMKLAITREIKRLIKKDAFLFYLYIRHYISLQLKNDLTNHKYKTADTFKLEEKLIPEGYLSDRDYIKVNDFLYELTGSIQKTNYWEYETYHDKYDKAVGEILSERVSEILLDQLPETVKKEYSNVYHRELTPVILYELSRQRMYALQEEFLEKIAEEYFSDLINLAALPFDEATHQERYHEDLMEQEHRKEQELLAIKQEEKAEERMLEDIFGREYNLSLGRDIDYVLHIGETNTGKTYRALERMKQLPSGIYLAPLRLLALEVYDKLNAEGVLCGLKTGEEEKDVDDATHISCTVEMFHERDHYDIVIIDEAQMVADKDRGFSWYKAITKANAKEVHIIGSKNSKEMVLQLLGDSTVDIREYKRDVPLEVDQNIFRIKHATKGDALVCFSRKRVLETASALENSGHSVSMIYGSMPPETRKKQMKRFVKGETSVIVSTDAIGMGLNLPIRRIVFLENEKFDGTRRRRLTSQEVKQIAGRAGRKGIYNIGRVAFSNDIKIMTRLLEQEDKLVQTFTVAPTNAIFERFQSYSRDFGYFLEIWEKFECPFGTKKASLSEERELYRFIQDTEIEARFSLIDLYGFLHLPFSKKESELTRQWRLTMEAIVSSTELPEPRIKSKNLEELELSYKAVGLHLLFLYRLGKRTEALYWERLRLELSDDVHEQLKTDVKKIIKKCKHCGRNLPADFRFHICDACHWSLKGRNMQYEY
ncbi:RNA helicase [Salipaludibacillus neizhouensis]|uniref:RNA helicase n=2 Tax=Salipaludibacillus neizhouensis TaxID=885475 RepID=A0A3A9K710_9BACI|nr:helicase-related protein [Salipaludibacillus neizhouensis]RKL66650.1 RNA helicase [Salipaludibacillus neizhouensis]